MSITKQKHINFFIKTIFFIFMIISVSFEAVKAQEENRETSPPAQSESSSERKETSQEKSPKKSEKTERNKTSEQNKNSSNKKIKKPEEKQNSETKQPDKPESQNAGSETENKTPEENHPETKNSTPKPEKVKNKNEPQTNPENENESFNLPKVSDSEVNSAMSKFIPKPKSQKKKANIFLTILSWSMIISGIFIILKVIFDNLKIPRGFDPRIKIKHGSKKNNRKNRYDLNKLND